MHVKLYFICKNSFLVGTITKSHCVWGGGGALTPHFGRYMPRQSAKWGARSELERENGGLRLSGTDFVGRVWLALWPAAITPWRLAAMNGLIVKKF